MRRNKRSNSLSSSPHDKIFAIGDIHGCADELQKLLEKLPLTPSSKIVFIGDYVDRGENSKEVIDIIINLRNYYEVVTLLGNHEAMFLDFINDPGSQDAGAFIYNGGSATLASYATKKGSFLIPDDHMDFLKNLRLFSQTDTHFFVHAGVPNVDLDRIIPGLHRQELLWVRETFHNSNFKWKKLIVHGHTPVPKIDITPKRVNVDTGCVFENYLTAFEVKSRGVYTVKRAKKTEHTFLRDENSIRMAVRFEGKVPVNILVAQKTMRFQTLNYSEFGIFVECLDSPNNQVFKDGDKVQGEIKLISDTPLKFTGLVVRTQNKDGKFLYAIQLDRANKD